MTLEASAPPKGRTSEDRTTGRTAAWLGKQVEVGLARVGLSAPQYRILSLLDESSAFSSDLAERMAVRPPSITAVVDGLVARKLAERNAAAGDRRRIDVSLTDAGRQLLSEADAAVAEQLRKIARCLDEPDDRARAKEGLLAWRKALQAYRSVHKVER